MDGVRTQWIPDLGKRITLAFVADDCPSRLLGWLDVVENTLRHRQSHSRKIVQHWACSRACRRLRVLIHHEAIISLARGRIKRVVMRARTGGLTRIGISSLLLNSSSSTGGAMLGINPGRRRCSTTLKRPGPVPSVSVSASACRPLRSKLCQRLVLLIDKKRSSSPDVIKLSRGIRGRVTENFGLGAGEVGGGGAM